MAESISLSTAINQLENERKLLLHEISSLELDLSELSNALKQEQERQIQATKSSEQIATELENCQTTLKSLQLRLNDEMQLAVQADNKWIARRTELETQRNLRRWKRHGSPEEQAKACALELEPLQKDVRDKQSMVDAVQAQLVSLEGEMNVLQQVLEEKKNKKKELGQRQNTIRSQLDEVNRVLETMTSEQKGLWKRENEIKTELEIDEATLQKERGVLNRLVGEMNES